MVSDGAVQRGSTSKYHVQNDAEPNVPQSQHQDVPRGDIQVILLELSLSTELWHLHKKRPASFAGYLLRGVYSSLFSPLPKVHTSGDDSGDLIHKKLNEDYPSLK